MWDLNREKIAIAICSPIKQRIFNNQNGELNSPVDYLSVGTLQSGKSQNVVLVKIISCATN